MKIINFAFILAVTVLPAVLLPSCRSGHIYYPPTPKIKNQTEKQIIKQHASNQPVEQPNDLAKSFCAASSAIAVHSKMEVVLKNVVVPKFFIPNGRICLVTKTAITCRKLNEFLVTKGDDLNLEIDQSRWTGRNSNEPPVNPFRQGNEFGISFQYGKTAAIAVHGVWKMLAEDFAQLAGGFQIFFSSARPWGLSRLSNQSNQKNKPSLTKQRKPNMSKQFIDFWHEIANQSPGTEKVSIPDWLLPLLDRKKKPQPISIYRPRPTAWQQCQLFLQNQKFGDD